MKKKLYKRVIKKYKKQAKEILSDVNGSYTGIPNKYEVPVQDADDL